MRPPQPTLTFPCIECKHSKLRPVGFADLTRLNLLPPSYINLPEPSHYSYEDP
ncbi:uncharacterized protein G2W53_036680 [Senna tora]|uniref:Uncharacterized protein n=1 Tax=Senna tora TaxID=362788 RepID=A0A834SUF6_9FABA|nr:uncharacterized protein G2W53_036680 [Senna tora]